jgi:predicted lysophospholipase L1 biosynthesis ABC-type transport system permease subunit
MSLFRPDATTPRREWILTTLFCVFAAAASYAMGHNLLWVALPLGFVAVAFFVLRCVAGWHRVKSARRRRSAPMDLQA